ncbi:DNA helicase IV [Asanoa ishikariensis]|uniref:DNA helicase IV n=1 Tax=Asanoa ishikariensis TaxID=137265 RepID=A0A1H3RZA1_9ACTN|nr:AAA family ATPase [Asanoa ishikariensis]SDZ30219.1 DNA helicase IV [Asanoa ishikariensis]
MSDGLTEERAHLAAARAALARMLDTARLRVATGAQVAGDRYTAETLGRMLRTQAKELAEEPAGPLFFGRLTFDPGEPRYHIGRRHIGDTGGQPLVVDWRAPLARAFYRASARDRMGVTTRRRYGWAGAGELTGYEDEHLEHDTASRLLADEIERPRVGPMRDIVATIQPEQDELVRADLDESVCVQGAPGTGKTAVGLHRAAYLLYSHRARLSRGGVLVLGPNPAFLAYISSVLPALGEVDVSQRTLDQLLGGASLVDSDESTVVKHDPRMATMLARALYGRLGEPTEPLVVPDGAYRWRVSEVALARLMDEIWQESPRYGVGRERLRSRLVDLVRRQAERRGLVPGEAWARQIGRSQPVRDLLDRLWPRVRPPDLVARLLRDPSAAADGILSDAEQEAIRRPPRRTGWSAADLVLVDEVAGLIEQPASFGHIVVDEAQDLSPMECRVIARRSAHGSLTVLGDLAQGTTPWAATSWESQLGHLGKPSAPVVALTAGFRVPGAVVTLANRLLATLDVAVPPTRAVRDAGSLRVLPSDDLCGGVAAAVKAALDLDGSVAVIAAPSAIATLSAALPVTPRLTVLPAGLAKGLEYDHVVVVEPADIAAEPRGPHLLYVVLTRAVSRLDIVHCRPLPPPIAG